MYFNKKKGIFTARSTKLNGNCNNQAKLLMIVDGANRYYMAIKNLSRLLKLLNVTHKGVCHFSMNCLEGFCKGSGRVKHYEY